jgi:CheY-like chemotaxis protein
MMPVMDGPATLLQLQRSAFGKDIPVVFMTARVRDSETQEYMQLGASGVVAKPFDPSTLPFEIERIWRGIQDRLEQNSDDALPPMRARG